MLTPEEIANLKKRIDAIKQNINTPLDITPTHDDKDVPIKLDFEIEEQNGIL